MLPLSGVWRQVVLALIVVAIGSSACRSGQSEEVADRFDATLTLLPDGSLDVREVWEVTFGTRPATTFDRTVQSDRADVFFDVSAAIDGRPVSAASGPNGRVAITPGRRLRVQWTFPPTTSATRRFELGYRASSVIEMQGVRGLLRWDALGPGRRPAIRASRLELTVPPNVVFYGAPGVAEQGWTVAWRPSGIIAERTQVSRDERATVQADVSLDTLATGEPVWQFRAARARQFMPAFLSGGLFFLVIGAGVLWIVRFQHPTQHLKTADATPADDDLEPALALAVARRTLAVPLETAQATLVDLVRSGRASLQSGSSGGLLLGFDSAASSSLAHEQVVIDQIWLHRGKTNVTPGEVARGLERDRRKFQRALIADLIDAGLADRERVTVASGLRLGGQVSMVFGAVCGALVGIGFDRFGPWPFAIPASIFVVGVALVIAGERFSILTTAGEQASAPWRARIRQLRQTRAHEGATAPIEVFGRWLSIAAGSGFGVGWVKAFGSRLPESERPIIALVHAASSHRRPSAARRR